MKKLLMPCTYTINVYSNKRLTLRQFTLWNSPSFTKINSVDLCMILFQPPFRNTRSLTVVIIYNTPYHHHLYHDITHIRLCRTSLIQ